MKIALCDDEKVYIDIMEDVINEIETQADIYKYTSAEELIKSGESFDIAFLDIKMRHQEKRQEDSRGFAAAEYVKKKNTSCIIAFFTNYDSYAREGYKYRAYRFILKDEGSKLIKHDFLEVIQEYYRVTKNVPLIYSSGKIVVSVKNIMYIHMEDHYAEVYLDDGTKCLWRKSLADIEMYLEGTNVDRCHNSYMVNMDFVKEKSKKQFILKNGVVISIGRKYIKEINRKYKNL